MDTAIGIGWDFVGGIGKLGGKVSGKAVEKLVSKIDKGIAKAAIRLGGNMLSEGVEEAVQTVLEPVFRAVATGESFAGVDLEEVVYSGLLGALSAGFIEGGGRNAKAELQVKDNGGSSAAGLRLLKSTQPAADAPLSLRGRSPWQSASSKAIDFRGTYDESGASGGTDSSLQAQNDPEVSNRNANLQAQRVNTEPSADTQAAGRGGGVEAYAKLLREVMTGTGSDVTGANRWSNGVAVQASGGKGRIVQGDAVSPTVKQPDRLGSRSLHALDGGADADVPVRQSDAGKFGVEQYGELLHQAGLDWDTAGKLSEIGLRIPSNIAESRNMAAPNVTAIPNGSMKAAGPQQRAVAADAEGYARRLQEVMPEFGAENGETEGEKERTSWPGKKVNSLQSSVENKWEDDILKLGIRYLNKNDELFINAKKIKPLEGFEDIVTHGDPISLVFKDADGGESNVSAEEFVNILMNDPNYKGGNIRLIACQVAADGGNIPRYIAQRLNVTVLAPTETVNVDFDGNMILADNDEDARSGIETGRWIYFEPKQEGGTK